MLNTEQRAVRTRNTEQSVHGTRTPYTEQCAIVSIAICSIAIKKIFVRFGREQLMAIIVNNDKNVGVVSNLMEIKCTFIN